MVAFYAGNGTIHSLRVKLNISFVLLGHSKVSKGLTSFDSNPRFNMVCYRLEADSSLTVARLF